MQATPPVAGIIKPGEWTGGSLLHRTEGEIDEVGCVYMYFHSYAHGDPLAPDEAGGGEKWGRPGTSIMLLCPSVRARGGGVAGVKPIRWVSFLAVPLRSFETWDKPLNSFLLISSSV